jgi:inner membrane protein
MDSLTQIVLGAGVAELMIGKKIGNKAMLIGAIAGTIPDLDVLLTIGSHDPLTELRVHRSYSHSMFTHFVLAAPLAWLTYIIWKKEISFKQWYWVWFMGLFTHAVLDSFTTYGTRLFLPFTDYLIGLNNISVIDPLYTLPFMGLLIAAMCYKRNNPTRWRLAKAAMYISTSYMLLTFGLKYWAHQKFNSELKRQNISYTTLSTSPTIFNSILWAGMAYTDSTLIVGEYSLIQDKKDIDFMITPRNRQLVANHPAKDITKTLEWFSQDINAAVQGQGDSLHYIAAKWGRFDYNKYTPLEAFTIYYTIYKDANGQYKVTQADPSKVVNFKQAFKDLWNRIFHW